MIKVNDFVINEKMIKFAKPYAIPQVEGIVSGFPRMATEITFLDNTKAVFDGMDIFKLFTELESLNLRK